MTATITTTKALIAAALAEANAALTPPSLPTISSFTATPSSITNGGSVVLDAVYSAGVTLSLNGAPVTLPKTVSPSVDTTYTLIATNAAGASSPAVITVVVRPSGGSGGPTPPDDPLIVGLPSSMYHVQASQKYKFDLIRQSKTGPAERIFKVPLADPSLRIVAQSTNGAMPTRYAVFTPFGHPTQLYSQVQRFRPINPADPYSGLSDPFNPENGDKFPTIVKGLAKRPTPVGKRGIGQPGPYVNVLSHPTVFPAINPSTQQPDPRAGQLIPRAPIASLWLHNGQLQLVFLTPIPGTNWSTIETTANGGMTGVDFLTHICSDRRDRGTLYGCQLFADAAGNITASRVFRAVRGAGAGSLQHPENAAAYTISDEITGLSYASDVKTDDAGNLFAIDAGNGHVWLRRFGQPTGTAAIYATAPNAYAMDISGTTLRIVFRDMAVRDIDISDLSAPAVVGPNIMPASWWGQTAALGDDFYTASFDKRGSNGPIGTFHCSRVHTVGNTNQWRFDFDAAAKYAAMVASNNAAPQVAAFAASVKMNQGLVSPSMHGWLDSGANFEAIKEPYSHYDWIGGLVQEDQGFSWQGGYANHVLTWLVANPSNIAAQSTFPVSNYTAIWRGKSALKKMGFDSMVSTEGFSIFAGCDFDSMAELDWDALEAFLRGGLISETPRPELVGHDLLCLMALIAFAAQRSMIDGKPWQDSLFTWFAAKYGAQYGALPNPAAVVGLGMGLPESANYLEARQASDGHYTIHVVRSATSTPDRYSMQDVVTSIALPVPSDAVIVADEGFPFERVLINGDGTALSAGQHALTIRSASMPSRAIAVNKL